MSQLPRPGEKDDYDVELRALKRIACDAFIRGCCPNTAEQCLMSHNPMVLLCGNDNRNNNDSAVSDFSVRRNNLQSRSSDPLRLVPCERYLAGLCEYTDDDNNGCDFNHNDEVLYNVFPTAAVFLFRIADGVPVVVNRGVPRLNARRFTTQHLLTPVVPLRATSHNVGLSHVLNAASWAAPQHRFSASSAAPQSAHIGGVSRRHAADEGYQNNNNKNNRSSRNAPMSGPFACFKHFNGKNGCPHEHNCRFSHDRYAVRNTDCPRYLTRRCPLGDVMCPMLHDANKRSRVPCEYYMRGKCWKGAACYRNHDDNELRLLRPSYRGLVPKAASNYDSSDDGAANDEDDEAEDEVECAICLNAVMPNDSTLRCGHQFHNKCIMSWLKHKLVCPLCRAPC